MEIGDKVSWKSQANAYTKLKQGIVVEIVKAEQRPNRELFPSLYKGSGCGWGRNHESYVIKVGNKFYWPLVKYLKKEEL